MTQKESPDTKSGPPDDADTLLAKEQLNQQRREAYARKREKVKRESVARHKNRKSTRG